MDIKVGQDIQGPFAIIYGPKGVQWIRGQQAELLTRRSGLSTGPLVDGGSAGHVAVAGKIIEAVSHLGQWYEMRQIRLLEEAIFEERRIHWLISCANLVLNDIQANGMLDAKAAFYLSREASKLFEACEKNPKIDLPGTILYMCHGVRRHLADFNAASHEYLSAALHHRGALTTGSPLFGKTLKKILGDTPIPSDASWLEYYSAEKQFEAMLALASKKKSIEVDWKDIAKSAVLLSAFIPLPVFWGSGTAARMIFAAGGMASGAVASYGIQPMLQLFKDMFKNIKDTKQLRLIEEYHDLLLLQFEAANTARLLWVQGRLLEGTKQKKLILLGQSPITALPSPGEMPD